MEHIYLSGSEAVENAGHAIARAAGDMRQAAASLVDTLWQHRQWMDDWLARLTAVLERSRTDIAVTIRRDSEQGA